MNATRILPALAAGGATVLQTAWAAAATTASDGFAAPELSEKQQEALPWTALAVAAVAVAGVCVAAFKNAKRTHLD